MDLETRKKEARHLLSHRLTIKETSIASGLSYTATRFEYIALKSKINGILTPGQLVEKLLKYPSTETIDLVTLNQYYSSKTQKTKSVLSPPIKKKICILHRHRLSVREIAEAASLPYHQVYTEVQVIKVLFRPAPRFTIQQLRERINKLPKLEG